MTANANLEQVDSEIYLSYHKDGLLDIFIGSGLLLFGLAMFNDLAWMGGVIAAVLVPLWLAIKKLVTAPRVDSLEVSPAQHLRMEKTRWRLTVLGLVTFLLGVFVFWLTVSGDMPAWLRSRPDLLFGSIFVVGLGAAAAVSKIARFYVYAALTVAVFIGGSLLNATLPLAIILTGSVVFLAGLGLLIRFLREHPATR